MEDVINYLNSVRREYAGEELSKKTVMDNPFDQLSKWIEDAINARVIDPSAMILSTVNEEGRPVARIVALRGTTKEGLVFYTNYDSEKGYHLKTNPFVAITFLWVELDRQVRISGKVERTSAEQSDIYFSERPRESQISAAASPQSKIVNGRKELEKMYREEEKKWEGKEVQRPENWGGYIVVPDAFEFWQGRPNRLHDRIRYMKDGGVWRTERLAP